MTQEERSKLCRRLVALSTVVSGNAQLLAESSLDDHQQELVAELITSSAEMAKLCNALQADA